MVGNLLGDDFPDRTAGNFLGNVWDALILPGNGAGRVFGILYQGKIGEALGEIFPPKPLWHRVGFELFAHGAYSGIPANGILSLFLETISKISPSSFSPEEMGFRLSTNNPVLCRI